MATIPRRVWLAFLLAPMAAVAALMGIGAAASGITAAQAWDGGFFVAFFGVPIAFLVGAAIGLPLYGRYASTGRLTTVVVIAIATAAGAVTLPIISAGLSPTFEWMTVGVGALMGLCAGATFALVAGPLSARPSNGQL